MIERALAVWSLISERHHGVKCPFAAFRVTANVNQGRPALRAASKMTRTPSEDVDSSAFQAASISVVENGAARPAIRHPSMNPPSKVLFSSFINRCSSRSFALSILTSPFAPRRPLPLRRPVDSLLSFSFERSTTEGWIWHGINSRAHSALMLTVVPMPAKKSS
jgi:hypothetical protein